jgi:hypothetical protein
MAEYSDGSLIIVLDTMESVQIALAILNISQLYALGLVIDHFFHLICAAVCACPTN